MNLETLITFEFQVKIGACGTPHGMRRFYSKDEEVLAIRKNIQDGLIPEQEVRDFIQRITQEFKSGVHFHYDDSLAALAAVMDGIDSPFSEEFLKCLAAVNISEMPMSPRVARLCLENRLIDETKESDD